MAHNADDDQFIENTLRECLVEFKKIAEIDPKFDEWLLNRFRSNFQGEFPNVPHDKWEQEARWLKRQTKAMAHYAIASALINERPIMIDDLKASVDQIRAHNPNCRNDIQRGRFCV